VSDDILEIYMQSHAIDCFICGKPDSHHWGVPIINGDIVSNDFPEWIWGMHGGGVAVCQRCYEKHERGEIPTFDRYYLHLGGGFIEGDGI